MHSEEERMLGPGREREEGRGRDPSSIGMRVHTKAKGPTVFRILLL